LLPLSLVNVLVTGLVMLAIQSASPAVVRGLDTLADVTQAIVAIGGFFAVASLIWFLLQPAEHRRMLASTSARFAAMAGGTHKARMGA
jgi:NADH-quinone oxidoreductase subunit H